MTDEVAYDAYLASLLPAARLEALPRRTVRQSASRLD